MIHSISRGYRLGSEWCQIFIHLCSPSFEHVFDSNMSQVWRPIDIQISTWYLALKQYSVPMGPQNWSKQGQTKTCSSSEYVLTYTCLLDLMGQNPGTFSFTSICLGFTDVHPLNMWYLNVLCRFRPIHPLDLWEFNSWLWKSWPIDDMDGYLSLNMMTFHCYIYIPRSSFVALFLGD